MQTFTAFLPAAISSGTLQLIGMMCQAYLKRQAAC